MSPWKVPLFIPADYSSPWVDGTRAFEIKAIHDSVDESAGTRTLTLEMTHPGLIWTAIAFDAHVLSWSLDENPPPEHTRHVVKEASFYGMDTYTIDMVIKLPGTLLVNYIGVEEAGMWPGKQKEKHLGGKAMEMFEQMDGWLQKEYQGTIDALLLGCVAGVTSI